MGATITPEDISESAVELSMVNQEQEGPNEGLGDPERSVRFDEEDLQESMEVEHFSEEEAHTYDTPFDNTRIYPQHQDSSDQQTIIGDTLAHTVQENHHNNQLENVLPVIEESQQNTAAATSSLATKNAPVTVTLTFEDGSHLHDVPGFQDPELREEDEEDGRLHVNAPPNIYSSQILSTVVNDQDEGGDGYEVGGGGRYSDQDGTETIDLGMGIESDFSSRHRSMDILLSTGKDKCTDEYMCDINILFKRNSQRFTGGFC